MDERNCTVVVRFFGAGAYNDLPGGTRVGSVGGVMFHYIAPHARLSKPYVFDRADELPEGPTAYVDEDPPASEENWIDVPCPACGRAGYPCECE